MLGFLSEEFQTQTHTDGRQCEDREKTAGHLLVKGRCLKRKTLLIPQSWTSSLQNCVKITLCGLSHSDCNALYGRLSKLIRVDPRGDVKSPFGCMDLERHECCREIWGLY